MIVEHVVRLGDKFCVDDVTHGELDQELTVGVRSCNLVQNPAFRETPFRGGPRVFASLPAIASETVGMLVIVIVVHESTLLVLQHQPLER